MATPQLSRRRRRALVLLLAFLVAALPTRSARAALIGNIFSGPTTADAASTYWNPAAMTLLDGHHLMLFGAISAVRLQYQRDTPSIFDGARYPQADVFIAKPAPAFGFVTDATLKDFRFGLGVSLPVLDGATWKLDYDGRPSSTRYYAEAARLGTFGIHTSAAYRIAPWLSIGAGFDVFGAFISHRVMTDFGAKINQIACASNPSTCSLDAPLARENPAFDALTTLDGLGFGVGASLGILVTPFPWLRIGAGFHSGAGNVTVPVDLEVQLPKTVTDYVGQNLPSMSLPALTAQGDVEVSVPMIVTFGVAVWPTPKLELAFDLHWMQTSRTALLAGTITKDQSGGLISDQVLIKAREDSLLIGLRGTYRLLDGLLLALRFEYDKNTRPDSFISPVSVDFNRFSFHLGARWQATRWIAFSVEYGHYFMPSRDIKASAFAPNANPTTPQEEGLDKPSATGLYSVQADRVGVGVEARF